MLYKERNQGRLEGNPSYHNIKKCNKLHASGTQIKFICSKSFQSFKVQSFYLWLSFLDIDKANIFNYNNDIFTNLSFPLCVDVYLQSRPVDCKYFRHINNKFGKRIMQLLCYTYIQTVILKVNVTY